MEIELNELSVKERVELANATNVSPVFLWQCGVGHRAPSLETADRLIDLEPRLTIKTLLAPKRRRQISDSRT